MSRALSYFPRTGRSVRAPAESTVRDVDAAASAAAAAAGELEATAPAVRAGWLEAVAGQLEAQAGELTAIADEETALGAPRLAGELAGAAASMRFYGAVAAEGSWLRAAIDSGAPARRGAAARPGLRRVQVPLGPVAVFGASNFPFGFGVAGHDTASAIAAGCPVVAKAHPAHPRLSARLAQAAAQALAQAGAPAGTLGLISGLKAGQALVTHPLVRAVGFTGSQAGGLALWRLAATRPEVVPVYAEMGTVNAVVVTPAAAAQRPEQIAAGFVGSFTLGMGQFCTKPGLLAVPAGSGLGQQVARALAAAAPAGWLASEQIAIAYADGVRRLEEAGLSVLARVPAASEAGWSAAPAVLQAGLRALAANPELLEECFGPVALVTEYASEADLSALLARLPGSLAAAVHAADGDPELPGLVARLRQRCGRVVVNGWPTGVVTGWAQQHGGPWPATTSPAHSSVGAAALDRFTRPVAFQDVPDEVLPPALQDANPWQLPRRVDGVVRAAGVVAG